MSNDSSNGFNPRAASSPQVDEENHTSFVRRVRSRVTGLLPSSLSKWFGSDGTKKAVVRLREEEDDEGELVQPPFKKPKLPSSSTANSSYTPTTRVFAPPRQTHSDNLFIRGANVAGPSRETNEFYCGDDNDSESGESTSGYSSIAKAAMPINTKKDDTYDISNVINANQLFSSTNFGNSRTLFTERNVSSHGNTSLSSRRPSFNASTFGSPSFVDRTLSTQQIMNSPFYNGCTMYGGAAAHSRPNTPKTHVKPVNESTQHVNNSTTLSKTARRILDTLEQYATDVSKIPNPLGERKTIQARYSGANPFIVYEHKIPNQELQVPTVPDLLKMKLKERLQSSTESVRKIASRTKNVQSRYRNTKHSSKISSSRQKPSDEVLPKLNLPPSIAVPIATLPKFDLSFPLPSSNMTKPATVACSELPKTKPLDILKPVETTPTPSLSAKPKTSVSKMPETVVSSTLKVLEFKFSDPLVLAENLKSVIAINDFKFSEPVIFNKLKASDGFSFKSKNKAVANKLLESPNADVMKLKPSNDTWECTACLIRNLMDRSECAACNEPKFVEKHKMQLEANNNKWECKKCFVHNLNKDTVCFKCTEPKQKPNGPITSFGNKFKPPKDTWECPTCMIRNKNDLIKCGACETQKPIGKTVDNTLDVFKLKSDQWECHVCMVRNPNDKLKCVACETLKTQSTHTSFSDKFKPPSNTWECPTCMIRNKDETTKCIACETEKSIGKTVGILPNSVDLFKLKGDQWECNTCMVRNAFDKTKCIACETPKTNASQISFGNKFTPSCETWECPTCMIRDKKDVNMCIACESKRPGEAIVSNVPKTLDMFKLKSDQWECSVCMVRNSFHKIKCVACETPKPNATQLDVNKVPTETPSFTFGIFQNPVSLPANTTTTTPSFTFGIKSTSVLDNTKNLPFVFGLKNTTQSETPTPAFSFGVKTESQANVPLQSTTELPQETLKRRLDTDVASIIFKPTSTDQPNSTSPPPNKYFVSSTTAFTPPSKPVTETSTVLTPMPAAVTTTTSTSGFNFSNNLPAPIFGTPVLSSTAITSVFETPSKPLFPPLANKMSLFADNSEAKTSFVAPIKPFEMPSQSKPVFESPAPSLNSGFNVTAPGFTFTTTSNPNTGFTFGAKPIDSQQGASSIFKTEVTPGGFSFGLAPAQPTAPIFSFNAPKPESSLFQPNVQPSQSMFGSQTQSNQTPLQNGLFNFGATPVKSGLNFGEQSSQFNPPSTNPAASLFNFGSAQPPATASGFNFGATSTPTFNADTKPSFNFTGGATPTFSAQSTGESPAIAQRRKMRAARRNPQR